MSRENSNQEGDEEMIDTSSQPKLPDVEEVKLDRTISQEDHDKLEKDIE